MGSSLGQDCGEPNNDICLRQVAGVQLSYRFLAGPACLPLSAEHL